MLFSKYQTGHFRHTPSRPLCVTYALDCMVMAHLSGPVGHYLPSASVPQPHRLSQSLLSLPGTLPLSSSALLHTYLEDFSIHRENYLLFLDRFEPQQGC